MNELSLILDFIAAGEADVRGRAAELRFEETALIERVTRGEATDEERARAAVLMRDQEEALFLFVRLLADDESSEDEPSLEPA